MVKGGGLTPAWGTEGIMTVIVSSGAEYKRMLRWRGLESAGSKGGRKLMSWRLIKCALSHFWMIHVAFRGVIP